MSDRTLGLNPDDFGTTGLTLGLLVGVAFNEPERALPRERRYGRGGGQEPVASWRLRAVQEVLRRNGVDLDTAIAADCILCKTRPALGQCCSSHGKDLCHGCYRRTHFVEFCGQTCTRCAAEGLDPTTRVRAPGEAA